jgi:hypothetical protein
MTPKPKRRQINATRFGGFRDRWWYVRVGSDSGFLPLTRLAVEAGTLRKADRKWPRLKATYTDALCKQRIRPRKMNHWESHKTRARAMEQGEADRRDASRREPRTSTRSGPSFRSRRAPGTPARTPYWCPPRIRAVSGPCRRPWRADQHGPDTWPAVGCRPSSIGVDLCATLREFLERCYQRVR